ncbi:MAG: BamA/TamA family outer membrane protein [Pseudomonadota bacterium]|nr:BamA/TamA family outer membrane protein [Pseudomonadota bacterium]
MKQLKQSFIPHGRALACVASLVAALVLTGCAAWRGGDAAPGPAAAGATGGVDTADATGAATATGTSGASAPSGSGSTLPGQMGAAGDGPAQEAAFDIRVQAPTASLRELVQRHSELQRYRAVTDLDDAEFARLMALAERDVRNLLGTEGYFSPAVTITREPPAAAGGRPTVLIDIEPGQATTIARVDIGFEGDMAEPADPQAAEGVLAQRQAIVQGWRLGEGDRFTQRDWASAKTGALRQLVEKRYPRGQVSYSLADVDAPAASAALTVRLDSGPLFRLGAATVKGASRYPPELAERLSWLKPGDIYDQQRLVDAQLRLAGSGYYDSAYISIDPEGEPAAVPVNYTVTEAKRHKVQLGVGYSTDGGPRLTLEHRDNTALGTPWRLDSKLHFDRKAPLLQAELTSLPNANLWRWGALARYMRQDDGELVTTSQTLRAGHLQTTERYDRHLFLQYDRANVTGSGTRTTNATDALLGDGAAISANFAWTGRYFDRMPVPSRGFGLAAEVGVGMTVVGDRLPFTRLAGRWLGIVPIGDGSSRLALRTEAGAVLADKRARLPSTYLFRTGGDTSVRGYGFRRIGIALGDDVVGPGRYMAVGSVEWQRPILQERFPGLLEHTLFIDVGSVANRVGDMRPNWGVGTGVRLITPVGPMQLDVAYGLQSKDIRLHMNVGFRF